ncbi:MAG: MFS transporter [Rhizobiales bacterium]|nr:MFS transporter [Hyphomicrobiales bacterium]
MTTFTEEKTEAALPNQRIVVTALGITQILAWGSTFYLLGVLAPFIARDTGWGYDHVVAGVSVGLIAAGIVSPRVGSLIARHGGRPVLAGGALLIAAGLLALALSPNFISFVAAWIVIGAGMGAGLYDAAFSTLGSIYGSQSRAPITHVTLFGGFASTVCWPLSALLVEQLGWRGACFVYAAIQIGVALPIHLLALPTKSRVVKEGAARSPARLRPEERLTFALVASIVTIGSSILALMGTHLLPLLQARGVELSGAVALGALVGPSQVGARFLEMLAGRHYHPVWTMVISVTLVALAALMLLLSFPILALAIMLYGAGNGIGSVARGTVPLALFGAERYPVLMGRLALPLLTAMAASPLLGGVALERAGPDALLQLLTALASVNVVLALMLKATRRKEA